MDTVRLDFLRPYQHPNHEPFLWPRDDTHGALLLHGFPGTPAEMRAVGQVLFAAGWTVHAPLLPGFGPAIDTLASRTYEEWLGGAADAFRDLKRNCSQILLVGNSMGGALALVLAQFVDAAGLVVAAPFTRLTAAWQRCLWPVVRCLVPHFKPFERADMESTDIRRLARRMFDNADTTNPAVQAFIRNIAVPTKAVDQVCRLGNRALRVAPEVKKPALILQGRFDRIVAPQTTRALISRMVIAPEYHEFDTGHDVFETDSLCWPQVAQRLAEFADRLKLR